jgi:Sulfotransferase family
LLRRAFGSTGVRGDLEDLGALTPRVLRVRRLPRLLRGHGSRWPPLRQYVELAGKVYRSTSAVTSSGTIIDSSKSIPAAMLLPAIRNVDPVVIHMVRDPRAVAFSRTRRKLTLGPGARPIEMDRDELWQTVLRWSAYNSAVELLRMRFHGSWMRVRYEDLCADPSGVLRALANFLEAPPVRERLLDKGSVDFGETHAMAGNPIIFRRESSSITEDDEWVSAMKEGQKALVTAGTFPLLARYGYPVWRRATVA